MFSMSEKSVPGTLVLIAPTGIGVPVAAFPGLVPHDDVADATWALSPLALALLPKTTTASAQSAAMDATLNLTLMGVCLNTLTSHLFLSSEHEGPSSPVFDETL